MKSKNKTLWGLFISYKSGDHYIGVYPNLDYTLDVIKELLQEIYENNKKVKEEIKLIKQDCIPWKDKETYYHCCDDGFCDVTWFVIQPISEQLTKLILKK